MTSLPVSVVIPTFRDGDALRRALQSVANQTMRPYETIVVDDAGGEETVGSIVADFASLPVSLVRLSKNVGPGGARNVGISASSQPFVAFLDADDEWHPEKLEHQTRVMLAPGGPQFTCHPKLFSGADWPTAVEDGGQRLSRRKILLANPASISTVIVRRDAVRHMFPSWYAGEDYAFVATNLLSGLSNLKLEPTLARAHKVAFGTSGLSARLLDMQFGEMRVHRMLWTKGLIRIWEYVPLMAWTLLKFVRRLCLVEMRRLRSSFARA